MQDQQVNRFCLLPTHGPTSGHAPLQAAVADVFGASARVVQQMKHSIQLESLLLCCSAACLPQPTPGSCSSRAPWATLQNILTVVHDDNLDTTNSHNLGCIPCKPLNLLVQATPPPLAVANAGKSWGAMGPLHKGMQADASIVRQKVRKAIWLSHFPQPVELAYRCECAQKNNPMQQH